MEPYKYNESDFAPKAPKGLVPRKTLTKVNALRFKEIFDRALDNPGEDIFVGLDLIGLSLSTAHNRIGEALLFLNLFEIEKSKYKMQDYQWLRGMIKFKLMTSGDKPGIGIIFKKSQAPIKYASAESISNNEVGDETKQNRYWKEVVINWLESDQELLNLNGIEQIGCRLMPEDIQWLRETFIKGDIEHEITPSSIKAIK